MPKTYLMATTGFVFMRLCIVDGAHTKKGPNDESANEQQNMTHHLYKLTLDQELHLAPIENPHVGILLHPL